jgi:hypothetical protein
MFYGSFGAINVQQTTGWFNIIIELSADEASWNCCNLTAFLLAHCLD